MHQTSATSLARDGPGPPTPADATDVRTDTIAASPETDPTAIQSMSRRPSPAPPARAAAVCARVLMARSRAAVQNAREKMGMMGLRSVGGSAGLFRVCLAVDVEDPLTGAARGDRRHGQAVRVQPELG